MIDDDFKENPRSSNCLQNSKEDARMVLHWLVSGGMFLDEEAVFIFLQRDMMIFLSLYFSNLTSVKLFKWDHI